MKTILYARTACPNPEHIRTQLDKLEKYAADFGYTDCEQIIDDGFSGTDRPTDRPGFDRLMDEVNSGEISTVIVVDLARIARNMKLVFEVMAELAECDVRLIALAEDFDSMRTKYEPNESMETMLNCIYSQMQARKRINMEINRWGRMHESYLSKNKPALYSALRECGRMSTYLDFISEAADYRIRSLLKSMREEAGLPEQPAAGDRAEWTFRMDELYKKAAKIVRKEMIEI